MFSHWSQASALQWGQVLQTTSKHPTTRTSQRVFLLLLLVMSYFPAIIIWLKNLPHLKDPQSSFAKDCGTWRHGDDSWESLKALGGIWWGGDLLILHFENLSSKKHQGCFCFSVTLDLCFSTFQSHNFNFWPLTTSRSLSSIFLLWCIIKSVTWAKLCCCFCI